MKKEGVIQLKLVSSSSGNGPCQSVVPLQKRRNVSKEFVFLSLLVIKKGVKSIYHYLTSREQYFIYI